MIILYGVLLEGDIRNVSAEELRILMSIWDVSLCLGGNFNVIRFLFESKIALVMSDFCFH